MKTNVRLKALGEPFQNTVHVDPVRVGPSVLEILFQPLAERVRDLVEPYELADPEHLRVISRRAAVKPLNDRRNVTEDAGVHQSCKVHRIFIGAHRVGERID